MGATTRDETQRVKRWLYSIPAIEYSIGNLKRALEDLETRYNSPPTWMTNPDAAGVSGGAESNQLESWAIFLDAYPARRSYLEDLIAQRTNKARQYQEVLSLLAQENSLAAQVIRKKYYDKVKPDRDIYRLFLFCSEEWFYKLLRKGIRFYYEALPEVFSREGR